MININRHNYETFFLLYIDNELSGTEKQSVELFLQENADLKPEFEAFKKTILQPEATSFENKGELLKPEINSAIQESLLLLLDNELSDEKKKEVEMLINNDAEIAKEWTILQQTQLVPDTTIVFNNKHLLHKKQHVPVISLYLKRAAIAAVLIGFGVWAGVKYVTNSNKLEGTELAGISPLQKLPSVVNNTVISNPNSSNTTAANNIADRIKDDATLPAHKYITSTQQDIVAHKQKVQKDHLSNLENINNPKSNVIVTANVLPVKPDVKLATNTAPSINNQSYIPTDDMAVIEKNTYAINTVYETDEEISDNKILYIDEEKIKRTKLGGLFRKVKRVFERTANIKTTGETLKIAGFEIAVK